MKKPACLLLAMAFALSAAGCADEPVSLTGDPARDNIICNMAATATSIAVDSAGEVGAEIAPHLFWNTALFMASKPYGTLQEDFGFMGTLVQGKPCEMPARPNVLLTLEEIRLKVARHNG